MYPFIRMIKEMIKFSTAPALGVGDIHISTHRCWPWDLDMVLELNNGRTLTLYDLGRIPMFKRAGLMSVLRKNRWGITMAGATIRYRRRVRVFDRVEMHSGFLGYDERFIYVHQTMWRKGEALSSIVYRTALTDKNGIVPTTRALSALGFTDWSPTMPDWVNSWIAAENSREWPPVY